MTIETGPSDLEDCARPNRFEIDLGVIAVAMPFISGICTRDPENCFNGLRFNCFRPMS